MKKGNYIIFDIDNTITINSSMKKYEDKSVNPLIKESLSNLNFKQVKYYSARNMLSLNENLDDIKKITVPIMHDWLKKNNLDSDVYPGKPYCGKFGCYVDDRSVNLNSFHNSINSGLFFKNIDLIICFYNAESSILDTLRELIELSPIYPNMKFILHDNGSIDQTNEILTSFCDAYPFFIKSSCKNNRGYGFGVKEALKKTSENSDYIGIAHGNFKHSILDFFRVLTLKFSEKENLYFTARYARKSFSRFFSISLRLLAMLLKFKKIPDCIGGTRLIKTSIFKAINLKDLSDDYTFDLVLAIKLLRKKINYTSISSIERGEMHVSTWDRSPSSILRMIIRYLKAILKESND